MKRIIFLSLMVALIMGSCSPEKKSPVEGTWNMIYGSWNSFAKTFPADLDGGQIKMYTKHYFSHIGQFKADSIIDNHGCGSYTLNGNQFEETIIYRYGGTDQGEKIKLLLDVQNDTLTIRWPVDENWNLAENFSIEKYVRLD